MKELELRLPEKSGLSVMINERMVNLSGNDLMNYLKSLRSDDIAKIEVITTPPAKYEAQGNSGIINIVLKKRIKNFGWSGSVGWILSNVHILVEVQMVM